jgi:hypothetical protein
MATITVRVPINGNDPRSRGWVYDVSQHIDAGNDVVFVDDADGTTKVEVSRVQLDSAGSIAIYGKGFVASDAKVVALAQGGFHVVGGIYGFVAANTSASVGIHVKI